MDYTDINQVLQWFAGIGGPYIVGMVVSLLAENWPTWHTLPRWVKFISPMLASVLISVGAVILTQQAEFVSQVSPWFRMIALAVITYLGTQQAYMQARRSDYALKAQVDTVDTCNCEKSEDDVE